MSIIYTFPHLPSVTVIQFIHLILFLILTLTSNILPLPFFTDIYIHYSHIPLSYHDPQLARSHRSRSHLPFAARRSLPATPAGFESTRYRPSVLAGALLSPRRRRLRRVGRRRRRLRLRRGRRLSSRRRPGVEVQLSFSSYRQREGSRNRVLRGRRLRLPRFHVCRPRRQPRIRLVSTRVLRGVTSGY